MSKSKRFTRGFTLIELLFSLLITSFITINVASILNIIEKTKNIELAQSSLEAGVLQLTRTLYGKEVSLQSNILTYVDDQDEFTISCHNNRLVKQPGYTIYQEDVDDVYFFQEQERIYMQITMDEMETIFWIGLNYEEVE